MKLLLFLLAWTCCGSLCAQPKFYETLNEQGDSLLSLGLYNEALASYEKARQGAHKAGDVLAEATALTNQGVAYRVTERPDSALQRYSQALALVKQTGEQSEMSHVLCSIAILYANTGRRAEAEDYARQASAAAHKSGDIDMVMYCDSSLGTILTLRNKPGEAIAVLRGMVSEAERQKRPAFMLKGYIGIIAHFQRTAQTDSVRHYLLRGDSVLARVSLARPEALGYLEEKANVLRAMGDYAASLRTQEKLLELRSKGLVIPLDRLLTVMARNHSDLGQHAEASKRYEEALAAKDSIAETRISEQLSEFSVQYDTQKKELEIVRLSASRTRLIAGLAVALAVSLALGLAVFLVKRTARLRTARRYIDGMEQERDRLGRELHDGIAGDILALRMAAGNIPLAEMEELLGTLHGDVRRISHELMPPRFERTPLPECMAAYLHTLPTATFTHEPGARFSPEVSFHLYRVLQETVSNIRKHAQATYIRVHLAEKSLVIENDGCQGLSGNGHGSHTLRYRAKALHGVLTMQLHGNVCTQELRLG